jgi:hypothetical protein
VAEDVEDTNPFLPTAAAQTVVLADTPAKFPAVAEIHTPGTGAACPGPEVHTLGTAVGPAAWPAVGVPDSLGTGTAMFAVDMYWAQILERPVGSEAAAGTFQGRLA